AERRYRAMEDSRKQVRGSVSEDDLMAARLMWARYREEVASRKAQAAQAECELRVAQAHLSMCEVRSPVRGVVTALYRKRGEAARDLEPVVQVEAPSDSAR